MTFKSLLFKFVQSLSIGDPALNQGIKCINAQSAHTTYSTGHKSVDR